MSTEDEVNFDAPVPKKKVAKKAKKAKKAAAASTPKQTAPFPGMTRTACADTCNAKGCAISGIPICAHPTKGGLPAHLMNDPAALKRIEKARAQLDVRLDPDRFK